MCLSRVLCLLLVLLLQREANSQLDVCGRPFPTNKIVNGTEAIAGEWCWKTSLHSDTTHYCGGSLINAEWVLTAAHCFTASLREKFPLHHVYIGRLSQSGPNPNEFTSNVTDIICHPGFVDNPKEHNNDNDICLLKLSEPVTFSDFICPVCLAAANSTLYKGTMVWVAGWGEIRERSPFQMPKALYRFHAHHSPDHTGDALLPDILQEVHLPIVGNRQCTCQNRYLTITDNMLCAGLREGGKDACQGDSGGSMVVQEGSRWVQAGVVSYGQGCARERNPGVYTRVSKYQDWINSIITADQPGFVQFSSNGTDSDLKYTC